MFKLKELEEIKNREIKNMAIVSDEGTVVWNGFYAIKNLTEGSTKQPARFYHYVADAICKELNTVLATGAALYTMDDAFVNMVVMFALNELNKGES